MATISKDNPNQIENLNTFVPAEWAITEKQQASVSTTGIATLSANNIFTNNNDYQYYPPVYYSGYIINNSYQLTGSQVITNASYTITTPLYPIYIVNLTSTLTITLPTPSASFLNCKIIFRRLNSTVGLLKNSFNIYDRIFTATNVILDITSPNTSAILSCVYNFGIASYVWSRFYEY